METVVWVLLSMVPVAGLIVLAVLFDRWGAKHDPMGGRPGNILPLDGESRRPRVYHD